ncbi:uncharacterized protein LOC111336065 [Stylophora pistillata]|uniref:uncharacterized protein LOC111336065 n=1 Tax=Stylophora pistillata TaxID=50429 RepID=UPI000C049175|nr:uncharacterized protein LOC111336065 [Stylophora pistillata]
MSTLSDIDKINDIVEMVTTMASLKIPTEGLKTLDEMKQKVKETLRSSKKKSSWTAKEAFSVLTEAKKEDERKRATLLHFYEHSDLCLNKMDEKVHTLFKKNIGNLKDKIASHKESLLQKEYIVLVADIKVSIEGETSSGKSTLVNLILGEQLLPYSLLSTTSSICELRYGDTPQLVAHFKDKKTGDTTKTVLLKKPSKAFKQTYLQQISTFLHLKTDREKGSDYEKVELFWPHNLLKENVVIVDSPGICESPIMDDIVRKYLPEAFAFIYVINSENAGGIQRDRVEALIEHARQVSLDKQRESSSNCALFVCNKWDLVPSEEMNEVKNFIVSKLTQCWPRLDPESQIIYMSAKVASEAQKLGGVTEEFGELMNGIKSMVLKSIEARLQIQWRWLDYLLARMAVHTKAFIRNSSEDRKDVIDRMMFITDRLQSIERQQGTLSKELQTFLENKTDDAVSALSRYLNSADVMEKFTSWTLDDIPNTETSWEVTKDRIQKALTKRLHETIKEWEEKSHVFSKARSSLIEYFQQRFNYVEGNLRALEGSVLAGGGTNSGSDPLASNNFSVAEKVVIGVTSPIWVPVGLVVLVVSVPFVGAIAVKEKLEDWNKTRKYNKDKCAFMAKASQDYLRKAAEEQQLKSFVEEQLEEAQNFLKQVLNRIPQLIKEDIMLCKKLGDENRCKKDIEMFYKPLYEESVKLRGEMALFGIKEVRTMDISCNDLEWQDDARLGIGAFASVYQGVLKIQGEAQPVGVALKVLNEELNDATASGFLSEIEILRKLSYPFIVKFYGAALRKEGNQLKAILVMELCKENLMKHIFHDKSKIPGESSSSVTATRDVIGWAKQISDALDYIHRQGIVHRDLKLENILLSLENDAKVADVGVSKEAKAITGTMAGTPMYLAPEVIKSCMYDYKADVYSFGIMLWEMWYGKRALIDVRKNDQALKTKSENSLCGIYTFLALLILCSHSTYTCLQLPGETSAGKSTLLNLILGEQLLPYSVLSTTSTIVELRYGEIPKLVAHYKNKESGNTTKTVLLDKPSEASKQSYLQQIFSFVHLKKNREMGSDYEKIELFWPHNLFKRIVWYFACTKKIASLGKLNHPFIVKFYGAARLRTILVMEICEENLRSHIFRHKSNIPGLSSTPTAARNVIGWAKDIADTLKYIHRQGIVDRDLKLENILLSQGNVVKVADVGVSKEARAITDFDLPCVVYQAFSVLTEAKKEDEEKRATLLLFYERTSICLDTRHENVLALLEKNIGNFWEKIVSHKQVLQKKEYIVLVAGETSSGKSTLLNLILGEQLLPYSVLSTTSTIVELRYGDTPKLVAHYKNKESGNTTETVLLDKPSEATEQSYLQQISSFVHLKENRERGSDYEKIELFWPHNLLKENIVIVDSPGVGESTIMDDIVKAYLPEAFAFIYVINSENAGGIQKDRVEKLIEHARQVSLDKQRECSSNCALFVCNKWDQVPLGETDEVKSYIVGKLKQCWPSLDPESQIIYMSAKDASRAQELGLVTKEFGELMNGIKSMVLKSIEARLQIQWRWLDYLLARIAYHTKAFICNSSEDRENVMERMKLIAERLHSIERRQGTVRKELQTFLKNQTDIALSALSKYLKSQEFKEKFSSWTKDDVPNTEGSWEVTKNYIQKALMKRPREGIEEWEEKNHVFSDARSSLIRYFQERFSYVEGQLRTLESSVLAGDTASSASGPLASDNLSIAGKVLIGVTSPIWVPVGLVVLVVSVPVVGALAVKEKLEYWNKTRNYEEDKCGFMAKASQEYLKEAATEQHLKSFVVEQLKEAQVCLNQVLNRIPLLIEEDKMLCQQLREENRSKKAIEDFYQPLHDKSVQLRDEMALFGIREVRTMDISCNDLEWQDGALLGSGAFAAVYRGTLKIRGDDKPVDVAVKVWNEELNDATASAFLSETEILRKLNYPSIVKFYGAALRKEGDQLKAILVLELCKENLMRHIFQHKSKIPGEPSSSVTATRDVIRWAKEIADALEYIHRQGIVHRDLKLENVLLSLENVAKVADVGVSKEAKAITGTMTGTPMYLAPEVIRSCMYDYKADVYSFGIMLWEMWYGKRALLDVRGDVKEFYDKVLKGARPAHVEGSNRPPTVLHDLMQHCWDIKPDNRPDAAKCYKKLTQLYQDAAAPS